MHFGCTVASAETAIAELGLATLCTDTMMVNTEVSSALARATLELAFKIR